MSALTASAAQYWNGFIEQTAIGVERLLLPGNRTKSTVLVETAAGRFEAHVGDGAARRELGHMTIDANGDFVSSGPQVVDAIRNCKVDLVFAADRFLTREIPLPPRASEFLDQIIASQIDKLTPWTSAQALFGSLVTEAGAGKLTVLLAAADRQALAPMIDAVARLNPGSLSVFAGQPDPTAGAPVPLSHGEGASGRHERLRRSLAAALVVLGVGVGAFTAWATWTKSGYDDRYDAAQSATAKLRASMRSSPESENLEAQLLDRKLHGPVATFAVDRLSSILPDDAYVTEIELTGDKIRVTGVSRDSARLIKLIEDSGDFADALFFAPTTSGANEPGERFHIETTIRPRLEAAR